MNAANTFLDFERPILELEEKIEELKKFSDEENIDVSKEIKSLDAKLEKIKKEIFSNLTPWQRVKLARHPNRPYTLDYINMLMDEFIELHGDRAFADDKAIICGMSRFNGTRLVIIGHQKGRDVKERTYRRFGMPNPEGYRKALRIMKLAEKFSIPIITFIDTPGAFPGIGAEERGQAEAIAVNLREMMGLRVPVLIIIIGEGGSGGALGIGVGDRVLIQQNAYYSVISPEGCAAILWKDSQKAEKASAALKLTAQDLLELNVVDEIVPEPLGGAHRDPQAAADSLREAIIKNLGIIISMPTDELLEVRYQKFRKMGVFNGEDTVGTNGL